MKSTSHASLALKLFHPHQPSESGLFSQASCQRVTSLRWRQRKLPAPLWGQFLCGCTSFHTSGALNVFFSRAPYVVQLFYVATRSGKGSTF